MEEKISLKIRRVLKSRADIKVLETSTRFFKEGEKPLAYGIKANEINKIAKEFYKQLKPVNKQEILIICEELWASRYFEEALVACILSAAQHSKYEVADFKIFEHWVKDYVNSWADCDTLCNHTIGSFVMMYPGHINELKKWARSPQRWVKRAAAVTLIIPARKGMFLKEIFEIADILIADKDDMIQKGYGWMLKAASQAYPKEVLNYVLSKKTVMPRTALRYAIEKMPDEWRKEAMLR
ncbi:DNA alkylation repair protein [Niabella aquatica]